MCGEIEDWQTAKQVYVRLENNANNVNITLNNKFDQVEEIRLDEVLVTGWNGGVSSCAYVRIDCNNMSAVTTNNEARAGVLVMVDVNNPHTVYSRPRVLTRGHLVSVNSFQLSIVLPDGTPVNFTEIGLCLTLVCRKGADELEAIRKLKYSAEYPPSVKDSIARNIFHPSEKK